MWMYGSLLLQFNLDICCYVLCMLFCCVRLWMQMSLNIVYTIAASGYHVTSCVLQSLWRGCFVMSCTDPAHCVWTCLSPYKEQISSSDTCRNMGRAEQDEFLSDSAEQMSITGVKVKKKQPTVNSGWPWAMVFSCLLECMCSDVFTVMTSEKDVTLRVQNGQNC